MTFCPIGLENVVLSTFSLPLMVTITAAEVVSLASFSVVHLDWLFVSALDLLSSRHSLKLPYMS